MKNERGIPGGLTQRLITSIGLIGIVISAALLGDLAFSLICSAAAGLMIWEVGRLSSEELNKFRSIAIATAGGAVAFAAAALGWLHQTDLAAWHAPIFGFAVCLALKSGRIRFFTATTLILLAAQTLTATMRSEPMVVLWLVAAVVATDVGGYFGGKAFKGPKLAKTISPNKRWSGIFAGWAGAIVVGVLLGQWLEGYVVLASVFVSAASQVGDLSESALKRAAGRKDSSALLPGHGGFCDRFDGLTAGSCAYWMLTQFDVWIP